MEKNNEKIGLFLFHHFIRSIWATYLFKFIAYIKTSIKLINKKFKDSYLSNLLTFEKVKSFNDLKNWSINEYRYFWDDFTDGEKKGYFDHDPSKKEFFLGGPSKISPTNKPDDDPNKYYPGDDCDGLPIFIKKKLKKLNINSDRVFIVGKNFVGTAHYDCLLKINNRYYLWNYGQLVSSLKQDSIFNNLNIAWNDFWGKEITWCKCYRPLEYIGGAFTIITILSLLGLAIFGIIQLF